MTNDLERIAQDGVAAWRRGDAGAARAAFDRVIAAGRASPQLWLLTAQASEALGDDVRAADALDKVVAADPRNPYALSMRGDVCTRAGDDRAASAWYNMALSAAAGLADVPPDLAQRLGRARDALAAAARRFDAQIETALAGLPRPARVAEALDILSGRAEPQLQQPTSFYYPGLPQRAFYDPGEFGWIEALRAAVPAMRAEAQAAMQGEGVKPYVERPENRPSKGHALLDDPRWSAFHLWESGAPVAANAARCPATMAALAAAPIPVIRQRSPMALFSILRAKTHIPPHWGMLNTRLICHIPLIVPPGCRLRVGNETREVVAGEPMIFDDSIQHEAWNDSDEDRVILLFEIWRPELSADERTALTAIFDSVVTYAAD
jgi:aspartyl/asparaginyl beta-hydroxylase (cupin superfamily)